MNRNVRLDGTITLLSPLSHIGESIGIDSYLSQDIIIGPDGKPIECFVFSGNAFRGQLRDMAAIYMTKKLGNIKYNPAVFYLLFSGGSLGGDQSVDIDQARMYRRNIPMLSIFGGGVGNQILTGKLKIGGMYPLVRECQRILPQQLRQEDAASWKQWTFEKSYTRMDDVKNDNRRQYLQENNQDALLLEGKKEKKETPQQMRYSVEMLAAGSMLYQRIDLCDMSELELGAFVSAFVEFSKSPYIGGKSGTGHGLIAIEYRYKMGAKEEEAKFLEINSDYLYLSESAKQAQKTYDKFLSEIYERYIEDNSSELTQLLTAGGK